MIGAIIKAILAAISVFRQEREIYNKPEMVKAATATAIQDGKDKLSAAEAVLADPNSTPEQHAEALRSVRLAHS